MGSRQPERNIPDVRDVFQRYSNGRGTSGIKQHNVDSRYSYRDEHSDEEHHDYNVGLTTKASRGGAKINTPNQIRSNNNTNCNKSSNEYVTGKSNNNYSRTLTEKDLKHIERHLSMKKTIRKQLSRHLSKAFVESESDQQSPNKNSERSQQLINSSNSYGTAITLNKNNVAKSESNFLELLKEAGKDNEDEGDSGHCSPTIEIDRARLDQRWLAKRNSQSSSKNHQDVDDYPSTARKTNVSTASNTSINNAESKKSNFWKKLTIRSKNKR